ncbi:MULTISPECIES: fluoride efflux transporter CrcB [unclassified Rhodococcus (in: high G+C Gram-positive bacteria)]|uniref:fluoride efflux transporter CrcB n=1 Tax=unclassified Rhodococcus (in: high G+C Gram-positive bacteria) TaxID=192944 RepID=UPI000B9B28C5|nr:MULTISPECIES: fluoride efflux transporter CrcB [unclassified Rhodococcus (in: high G+C Gram-positive bacteria)]MDI9927241.1 fluoride efflux transporter CrcB [Rhodococcus sp. IEGM 1341]MDV8078382.1 fluoride efflux transporter CrcB [Rhodococcus sp. IEGM 1370]OZF51241.1 chromosome condensation protein CrcB [Rhodococcus sp. 14-1411-2a]
MNNFHETHGATADGSLPVDPDSPAPSRPVHAQPAAIAAVALGGLVGTGVRYAAETAYPPNSGPFPFTTLVINLTGAFVLGMLLERLALSGPDEGWRRRIRLCIGTGVLGSYTTYSSFALETVELLQDHRVLAAALYMTVSVVVGTFAAGAGIVLAQRFGAHTEDKR